MAKKTRKKDVHEPKEAPHFKGITKRGKKVIALGIGILILGFIVLTQTDPRGQNWAGNLSPFLILGGYAAIAAGIVLPDRKALPPDSAHSDSGSSSPERP